MACTVLFYFGESPFFDRTSNNQVVITQAQMPGRGHMIATRDAFEDELRKRSGLEFMIASSQMDYGNPDCAESNGRWVIRKQIRTKQDGLADGINVLATYFVIGETIYMAPSIAKILSGKLVSDSTSHDPQDLILGVLIDPSFQSRKTLTHLYLLLHTCRYTRPPTVIITSIQH